MNSWVANLISISDYQNGWIHKDCSLQENYNPIIVCKMNITSGNFYYLIFSIYTHEWLIYNKMYYYTPEKLCTVQMNSD